MKVFMYGEIKDVNIGDRFFVGHCGSGHSVFGENATLTKVTKQHCVFTTDSGAIVKTKADNIAHTVGKAAKEMYFVSFGERDFESDKDLIHSAVMYWNEKKLCFDKK